MPKNDTPFCASARPPPKPKDQYQSKERSKLYIDNIVSIPTNSNILIPIDKGRYRIQYDTGRSSSFSSLSSFFSSGSDNSAPE